VSRWNTGSLRAALTAMVLALVLSGCGSQHRAAVRVTGPKYGNFGRQTVTVPAGRASSKLCKADANGLAGQAHSFVVHFGSTAASSTDVYYLGMRQELDDFEARRCSPGLLGAALVRQLTAVQRRLLLAKLPQSMAKTLRAALD
jgi:hypothetical protein